VSTHVEAPVQPVKKRKRGRETALDMVRSLGLVMIIIIPIWFLAQPPDSDEARVRVIDPSSDIAAFRADVTDLPVPGALPEQWRPNVSRYSGADRALRVGWVSPSGQYAEYSADSTGTEAERQEFLDAAIGTDAERLEPVTVDGEQWQRFEDRDGSTSLVRFYGTSAVVVGTLRASAPVEELEVLVRSLTR
jgi:hypothetical protein